MKTDKRRIKPFQITIKRQSGCFVITFRGINTSSNVVEFNIVLTTFLIVRLICEAMKSYRAHRTEVLATIAARDARIGLYATNLDKS